MSTRCFFSSAAATKTTSVQEKGQEKSVVKTTKGTPLAQNTPINNAKLGDKTDIDPWQDDRKGISDFAQIGQQSKLAGEKRREAQFLEKIGTDYTAAILEPLKASDVSIANIQIGQKVSSLSNSPFVVKKQSKQGPFTIFTGPDGWYSVFDGPAFTVDGSASPTYPSWYEPGMITQIHIDNGKVSTSRDVAMGTTRGSLIFSYGSPEMIWRTQDNERLIFLYKSVGSDPSTKGVVNILGDNALVNRAVPETIRLQSIPPENSYMAFTLKNGVVSAIDMFDAFAFVQYPHPIGNVNHFVPNQLVQNDFSLWGYELQKKLPTRGEDFWQQKGTIWNSEFIAYPGVIVAYDKKGLVERVLTTSSTVVTPRGIALGDTKFLLLFMYGMPTEITDGPGIGADIGHPVWVYTYKNPYVNNEYLLFTIDKGTNYIKSILLSDRPMNKIPHLEKGV